MEEEASSSSHGVGNQVYTTTTAKHDPPSKQPGNKDTSSTTTTTSRNENEDGPHLQRQQQQYPAAPQQQPPVVRNSSPTYYDSTPPETAATNLTLAMAVGGAIGLTAAAAVRWLNGGDFCWFPPASTLSDRQQQRAQQLLQHNHNRTASTSTTTTDTEQQLLVLGDFIEQVKSQTETQKQAMDRLQTAIERFEKKAVVDHQLSDSRKNTDQSMQFLKAHQSEPKEEDTTTTVVSLLSTLQDIRSGITGIRQEMRRHAHQQNGVTQQTAMDARLTTTLDQLDAALRQLASTRETDHDDEGDDPFFMTTKTTANTTTAPCTASVHNTTEETKQQPQERTPTRSLSHTPHLTTPTPATTPLVLGSQQELRDALHELVMRNTDQDPAVLRVGAQMCYLYVVNVARNPRVPRYRRIYTSNESFRKSVGPLQGVELLLQAVGFVLRDEHGANHHHWEWLPPSIHQQQQQPEDNPNTTEADAQQGATPAKSSSPKNPWLGDSEATYLQRLHEAELALAVLKTSLDHQSPQDLLERALQAANISSTDGGDETASVTPRRTIRRPSDGHNNNNGEANASLNGLFCQTPETGSILSPPDTKKHSSLASPPADFPPLHPLARLGATDSKKVPEPSTTTTTQTETIVETSDDSATDEKEAKTNTELPPHRLDGVEWN